MFTNRNKKNKLTNKKNIPPPPAKKIESIPQPLPKQSEQNTFLNTMKDGFSFGIGSSIGHRMIDGIFSNNKEERISNNDKPSTIQLNEKHDEKTDILFKKYNECMDKAKENNDIAECMKILE